MGRECEDCDGCEYYDHELTRLHREPTCEFNFERCPWREEMTDLQNKITVMEEMFGDAGIVLVHDVNRASDLINKRMTMENQVNHARRVAKSMKKADKAFRRGVAMRRPEIVEEVPEIYFSKAWEILTASGD